MKQVMNAERRYQIGLPILTTLFNLPYLELREKIKDICGSKVPDLSYLWADGLVSKELHNDQPYIIRITFYDRIEITAFGITYSPEHGRSKNIIDFDQYFKL